MRRAEVLDSFELKEGATRLLIEAALPANRAARTKLAIGESVVVNNEKEAAKLRFNDATALPGGVQTGHPAAIRRIGSSREKTL